MSVTEWIFLIAGMIVAFSPRFIAGRHQRITRDELVKLSPDYENINLSFIGYFLLGFLFITLIIFLPNLIDDFGGDYFPLLTLGWIAALFSILGITFGLFAMRKGVYPVTKYFGGNTRYAYSDDNKVVQLGRIQVIASVGYFVISIFATLIRLYFFG